MMVAQRSCLFLPALLLCSCLDGAAELASTRLEGLQISVSSIYRSGGSSDLDCTIAFQFTGEKAERSIGVSPVRIIEAVDDTERNLLRSNRVSFDSRGMQPTKTVFGFWQSVGGLRAPLAGARTIRHLEAEVDFFRPTANTPILTNFMSTPGTVLHQTALNRDQIEIVYENPGKEAPPGSLIIGSSAGKTIALRVDDPNQKVIKLAFRHADGRILNPAQVSMSRFGSRKDFSFVFQEEQPRDLNLVVFVSSPEATDTVRFSLDNVRLPWVELPEFEVSATVRNFRPNQSTNLWPCSLFMNFTGGPLTNALGIRNLWILHAEDDSGLPVKPAFGLGLDGRWDQRFSALPPTPLGDGRNVGKLIPLQFQSRNPKRIRILKGEAELVRSEATKRGMVAISGFMNRPGKLFDLPLLETNHVKLTFVGPVNYEVIRTNLARTNWVSESSGTVPRESPSDAHNSLEFSLDDPDGVVIPLWGSNEITFSDGHGKNLIATAVLVSEKIRVYRFEQMPPPDARLSLCLAVPESLQRVPFEIGDVPLN